MKKILRKIESIVLIIALIFSARSFDGVKFLYASATPSEISCEDDLVATDSELMEDDDENAEEIYEEDDGEHPEEPEVDESVEENVDTEEASPSDVEEIVEGIDGNAEEEELDGEEAESENEASPSEVAEINKIEEIVDEASPSDIEEINEMVEASPSEVDVASPSEIDDYINLSTIEQINYFDNDVAVLDDGVIKFLKDAEFTKTITVKENTSFDFGGYTVRGAENADPVFDVINADVVFENGEVIGKTGEDNKKDVGGKGGDAIHFYSESAVNTIEIKEGTKVRGGNGGKGKGKEYPVPGFAFLIGANGIGGNNVINGGVGSVGGGDGGAALIIINNTYDIQKIRYAKYSLVAGSAGTSYGLMKSAVRFGALPSSYDLRNVDGKNYVTNIKNQGTKATCFAFAPIAQAESYMIKNYPDYVKNELSKNVDGTLTRNDWSVNSSGNYNADVSNEFDLSEKYLAMSTFLQPTDIFENAGKSDIVTSGAWYSYGATLNMPGMFLSTSKAVILEDDTLDSLYSNASLTSSNKESNRTTLSNFNDKGVIRAKSINVHLASDYGSDKNAIVNAIKNDVMANNGVALSLVFNQTAAPTYSDSISNYVETYFVNNLISDTYGHALHVIGWNDNITKSQLGCESYIDRNGAFIVKDSHNHFSLVPYGINWFVGGTGYTTYEWEPVLSQYENTYYYDSGNSENSYSNNIAYNASAISLSALLKYKTICNCFKIKNNKEKIKAISYYSRQNDSIDVEICKSDGDTADKLNSATSLWIKNAVNVHSGNNIIVVDSDINCSDSDYIFVKLKSHNGQSFKPMYVDKTFSDMETGWNHNSTYIARSYFVELTNDSYFKIGDDEYKDLFQCVKTDHIASSFTMLEDVWSFNFRIKLLTNNYVTIDASPGEFSDGSTNAYYSPTAYAKMSDIPIAKYSDDTKMLKCYKNGSTVYNEESEYKPKIKTTLSLTAEYINKPTISFTTERGATPSDIKPNEYGMLTLPSISASGYTFNYWYKDNPAVAYDATKRLTDSTNFTLTAKWSATPIPTPTPTPHPYRGGGGGGGGGGGVRPSSNVPNQKTLTTEVASTKQSSTLAMWEKDAVGMWHMNFNVAGQNVPVLNSWVGLETDVNINGIVIKVVDYYFLDENGQMYTGWLTDAQGGKYFLDNSMGNEAGKMCFNTWKSIEGKQYYFGADGKLLTNSVTPDGNLVDANGQKINGTNTQNTQVGPII